MKKIITIIMICLLSLTISACGNNDEEANEIPKENTFETVIEVECRDNFMFSKYDLNLYVDDEEIEYLTHGESTTINLKLDKGKHKFKAENSENNEVIGEANFEVNGNTSLHIYIHCQNDKVELTLTKKINSPIDSNEIDDKNAKDLKEMFAEAGFTNIEEKAIKDLTFEEKDKTNTVSTVSIDGQENFTKNDTFKSDQKVIIEYHALGDVTLENGSYGFGGMSYQDVEEYFKRLGFTDIISKQTITHDPEFKDGYVSCVYINDETFSSVEGYSPNSSVVIEYYKYEKYESEYELAFVKKAKSYNIYYMFDTDTQRVVYFGNDDTYIAEGSYSGDFNSGVTINWDHGEFTEKFIYENNAFYATLYDGNGFDWQYDVCDIPEAQEVLNNIK